MESVKPNKRTAVISGGIKGQRAARKFPNSPPKFIKLVKESINEVIREASPSSSLEATAEIKSIALKMIFARAEKIFSKMLTLSTLKWLFTRKKKKKYY